MRSLTLSVLLLLLTAALMLGSAFYLQSSCNRLLRALELPQEQLPSEETVQEQLTLWEHRAPLMSLVAPRNSVRRVRELLLTLKSCTGREPSTLCRMSLTQLIDAVEQLKKDTLPLLSR